LFCFGCQSWHLALVWLMRFEQRKTTLRKKTEALRAVLKKLRLFWQQNTLTSHSINKGWTMTIVLAWVQMCLSSNVVFSWTTFFQQQSEYSIKPDVCQHVAVLNREFTNGCACYSGHEVDPKGIKQNCCISSGDLKCVFQQVSRMISLSVWLY
jgi:hypothetical protein